MEDGWVGMVEGGRGRGRDTVAGKELMQGVRRKWDARWERESQIAGEVEKEEVG